MDRLASRLPFTGLLATTVALLLLASACGSTKPHGDAGTDAAHEGGTGDGGLKDTASGDAGDGATEAPADMAAADVPMDVSMESSDGAPADVSADLSVDVSSDVSADVSPDVSADVSPDASTEASVEAGDASDGATVVDQIACEGVPVPGSNLVFEFDGINGEWVRTLRWRDSTGNLTTFNINASGGSPGCSSVPEFFGQAFAAPEGTTPTVVGSSSLASVTGCGTVDQTIVSRSPDCANATQIPVTTAYHFYTGAKADQVRVTRTLGFDASTGTTTGVGMRAFVPRVKRDIFTNVLIPNGAGTAVTTASVGACGGDCFTATGTAWNGKWFADVDPVSGLAMIVLRDPSITSDVSLTVNNDSNSMSNLSSFVVLQPTGGWTAPITEIEYLCFADLTTWPQASRDAATLPANCGP